MNFHKLPQVYDIVKDLLRNGVSCDEITSRLETLRSSEEQAKELPEWAITLSYSLSAMTSAVMFFHGTWKDALMSGALGLIPGLLRLVANRFETLWVQNLISGIFYTKTNHCAKSVDIRSNSMFYRVDCGHSFGTILLL